MSGLGQSGPSQPEVRVDARRPSAVLFDLDGTLTEPILDFPAIRRSLGVPDGAPILEFIESCQLRDPDQAQRLQALLHELELECAARAHPAPGLSELFTWLDAHGLATAVVTRNSTACARVTLERIGLTRTSLVLVTRDDAPPKPDPAPLALALAQLGQVPTRSWMVGDGHDDMIAGERIGCPERLWLRHARNTRPTRGITRECDGLVEVLALMQRAALPLHNEC